MVKRKLRNTPARRKALLGLDTGGAILAAAGINVAGTLAGAAMSSKAANDAAKQQAAATNSAAQRQAQAIKEQSEKAKEYQLESQDFIKEQNEENRQLQKDIQMSLQMLTGQQNVNDRLEASKIKVKYGGASSNSKMNRLNFYAKRALNKSIKAYNNEDYDLVDYDILERAGLLDNNDDAIFRPRQLKVKHGGSIKRRLRTAGATTPLWGSYNMPFKVTDGGGVVPVGTTPEGYDLYEIYGNDHEHYHKAQGGKYKSGVGIKFADGSVVEGEGNQDTPQGEYMLVTPNDAYFIAKNSIDGLTPVDLVKSGVHPLQAFAIQEGQKEMKGIADDGRQRAFMGGSPTLYDNINKLYPQVGTDTIGDTAVGVAYGTQNKPRLLRCGGRARVKAYNGLNTTRSLFNDGLPHLLDEVTVTSNNSGTSNVFSNVANAARQGFNNVKSNFNTKSIQPTTTGSRGLSSDTANLLGAGINALGNIGGAWITSAGNRRASKTLAGAYNQAAQTLANAYNSMSTIDMNTLRRQDFAAAHAMPALQAPVSQAESQLVGVNRDLERRLSRINKNSTSSAAGNTRTNVAELNAQDLRNKIYAQDQSQMQQIRQANAERVTNAAIENANLDVQANKDYTNSYLALLQYNNDIENQKILGAAGALSEGAVNGANAISQSQAANAQAWANAMMQGSSGFSNTLSAMAKRKADYENVLVGADTGNKVNAVIMKNDRGNGATLYNSFNRIANDATLPKQTRDMYREYALLLKNKFNFT